MHESHPGLERPQQKKTTIKQDGKWKKTHKVYVQRTHSNSTVHLGIRTDNLGTANQSFTKKLLTSPQAGTRMGNGKVFLSGVDQRNERVRRAREMYTASVSDMGGMDMMTTAQNGIIWDMAWLRVIIEDMTRMYVYENPMFDFILYLGGVKSAAHLAKTVGLHRVAKDMGKLDREATTLEEHLKAKGLPLTHLESEDADFEDLTENPSKPKRVRMKKPPRLKDFEEISLDLDEDDDDE